MACCGVGGGALPKTHLTGFAVDLDIQNFDQTDLPEYAQHLRAKSRILALSTQALIATVELGRQHARHHGPYVYRWNTFPCDLHNSCSCSKSLSLSWLSCFNQVLTIRPCLYKPQPSIARGSRVAMFARIVSATILPQVPGKRKCTSTVAPLIVRPVQASHILTRLNGRPFEVHLA